MSFQLTDYSQLRDPKAPKVVIPLNGQRYHAVAEVEADTLLSATQGSLDKLPENLPADVQNNLEQLAETNPMMVAQLGKAASSQLVRARDFMLQVLEPESAERWTRYCGPPAKGLSAAKRKAHQEAFITLPQRMAVFKDLVAHYAGRPTAPSSSSQNGDGGTGGTSTETAPAEA